MCMVIEKTLFWPKKRVAVTVDKLNTLGDSTTCLLLFQILWILVRELMSPREFFRLFASPLLVPATSLASNLFLLIVMANILFLCHSGWRLYIIILFSGWIITRDRNLICREPRQKAIIIFIIIKIYVTTHNDYYNIYSLLHDFSGFEEFSGDSNWLDAKSIVYL